MDKFQNGGTWDLILAPSLIYGSILFVGFYIGRVMIKNIRMGNSMFNNLLYPFSFVGICLFTYYILFINDDYYKSI